MWVNVIIKPSPPVAHLPKVNKLALEKAGLPVPQYRVRNQKKNLGSREQS